VYPEEPERVSEISVVSLCPFSTSHHDIGHHFVKKLEGIGIKYCWKKMGWNVALTSEAKERVLRHGSTMKED
tara:strand:- start:257 stop:472 length:216 start_codon:yes stop_codon:yes gene_type:complete